MKLFDDNTMNKPWKYFLLAAAYISAITLGHSVSVYSYFGGPPPTSDYERGQMTMMWTTTISFITCLFAFFILHFNLKSIAVTILINISFGVAIITSFVVIYFFRDHKLKVDKFQDYTVKYYKVHQKPPPFLERIQKQMGGYCCGAKSYLDYSQNQAEEFFNVPHSCCFKDLGRLNSACGRKQWKYLYIFLNSIMTDAMTKLETEYNDLDDLSQVQKRISMKKAQSFIDTHIKTMYQVRLASIRKNMTQSRYKELQQEEWAKNPGQTVNQLAAKISQRIYNEAKAQVDQLKGQILNSMSISFVPMGCWSLLNEMQTSNWKGFSKFKPIRDKVSSVFQGMFFMCVIQFIWIGGSVGIFNYYSVRTERGSPELNEGGEKEIVEIKEEDSKIKITKSRKGSKDLERKSSTTPLINPPDDDDEISVFENVDKPTDKHEIGFKFKPKAKKLDSETSQSGRETEVTDFVTESEVERVTSRSRLSPKSSDS